MLLYQSNKIRDFLGDVLGFDAFYRLADPIGAMTVNVMSSGHSHGWHFDEALFTVSVMLQSAQSGGEFEYLHGVKNTRTIQAFQTLMSSQQCTRERGVSFQ